MLTETNLAINQSCWTCLKLDWWWIPVYHFLSACFSLLLSILCSSLEIENFHRFKNSTEKSSPEHACSGHQGCHHYLVILQYQFYHLLYKDKDNSILKERVNALQKNGQPEEKKKEEKREFNEWSSCFSETLSDENFTHKLSWITMGHSAWESWNNFFFISIFCGCNRDAAVWNSRYIIIIERNVYAIKYMWCYLEL